MQSDVLNLVKQLSLRDTKTLSQKALKLSSECGELASKALAYDNIDGDRFRFMSKEQILDEVADVILVARSIAYSLDYNDDDILSMMKDKAIHWSHLKEQDVSDGKYPFEIHFTVLVKYLEGFIDTCNSWGDVKPIVLDLYHKAGTDIQVTTSTVVYGSLSEAISKMNVTARKLSEHGCHIMREKIETVPWHPAIGSMEGKYYETHIPIFLNNLEELELLRKNCGMLHISKNRLKPDIEGQIKIFATYRSAPDVKDLIIHNFNLNYALPTGFKDQYKTGKYITEYAVLDSNEELDARWLGKTINIT